MGFILTPVTKWLGCIAERQERQTVVWRSLVFLGVMMGKRQDEIFVVLRESDQASDGPGERLVESQAGEVVVLKEKAVRPDGTIQLRVVKPGWGTSGYYPAEVLERDGPNIYRSGTQMFWNHATATEESERPEGNLRDLAAVLISDSRWDAQGPVGPGLYADALVFEGYRKTVDEIGPYIGTSIRGFGRATTGEAEGRKGRIISALTSAHSVDFVTKAGAGGEIVQLFEAARPGAKADEAKLAEARNVAEWLESRLHLNLTQIGDEMFGEGRLTRDERIALSSAVGDALDAFRAGVEAKAPQLYKRDIYAEPSGDNTALSVGESSGTGTSGAGTRPAPTKSGGKDKMDELEKALGRIQALETERDRLAESLLMRDAQGIVREALAQSNLPGVTVQRLLRSVPSNPPVTAEGKLDEAGLKARVAEAVAAETTYLQEAAGWGVSTGSTNGRIEGMGGSQAAAGGVDMAAVEQRMAKAFADLGFATGKEG